jgi:hypothetical protein
MATRHRVTISKGSPIREFIDAAAKEAGFNALNCCLAELWNKKIHRFFDVGKKEGVDCINAGDILLLYEIEDAAAFLKAGDSSNSLYGRASYSLGGGPTVVEDSEQTGVVLHFRQLKSPTYVGGFSSKEIIGLPLVFCVRRRITTPEFFDIVDMELHRRFGISRPSELFRRCWQLYKLNDRSSVDSGGTLLQLPAEDETGTSLELGSQLQWFVVEWEDIEQIPTPLAEALSSISGATSVGRRGMGYGAPEVPLERCFEMFTEMEQLSTEDTWYCNRCKQHVQAFKQLQFYVLPQVLIVQLKRFSYTRYSRERLDTPVKFIMEGLSLAQHVVPGSAALTDPAGSTYDLAAISKHIGALGGGHYVAYARSSIDGVWYFFDDTSVRSVSTEEVLADKVGAYVLFYIRRDFRPIGWGPPVA